MKLEEAKIRIVEQPTQKPVKPLRSSIYTEDYKGEYYNIPIVKLLPYKNQARKIFDEDSLMSLAETIKEHGIRQPLTVIPSESKEGHYEIISGERRYRAAKLAGLTSVPCMVLHNALKAEEIAIIENIQREDLHPIELMKAYNNLLEHNICKSTQEIATKLGVAKSSVVETMGLKNISEEVQSILLHERISNRDFLRILCKTSSEKQKEVLNLYLKKNPIQKHKNATKKVVISIIASEEEVCIGKNRLSLLTQEQKSRAKAVLQSLIKFL